jgi:hypothetical protein
MLTLVPSYQQRKIMLNFRHVFFFVNTYTSSTLNESEENEGFFLQQFIATLSPLFVQIRCIVYLSLCGMHHLD